MSETSESPAVVQSAERKMSFPANASANREKGKSRRRRSSSLMYQEPPESLEQQSDQAVLPNLNAQWVNAKGMSIHSVSREEQGNAQETRGTGHANTRFYLQAPGSST